MREEVLVCKPSWWQTWVQAWLKLDGGVETETLGGWIVYD